MDLIPRARLTTQFLESNASTHESVFGALAEIVDNAYDSNTKKLEIDVQNSENDTCGQYYISLRDYGCGMTTEEINKVIAYGWSNKADNPEMIGMYGNGLKSGSMRCGHDCLVLTKKNNECSALLLSRTFIESMAKEKQNNKNEVICPCPSWRITVDAKTGERSKRASYTVHEPPLSTDEYNNADIRHDTEVDLIQKYSPFSNEEDFLAEFDTLSESGTCIYLYNLALNENGKTELNIDENDDDDILDVGTQRSNQEVDSLKKFLRDIYLKPKMEIYLRGKLIVPTRPYDLMYERRKYTLPQQKFRSLSKQKAAALKEKKKKIEKKVRDAKGRLAKFQQMVSESASKDLMQEVRKQNLEIENLNLDIKEVDANIKAAQNKNESEKEFAMYLGYNIRDRKSSGLRLYNKNRLIVSVDGNTWQSWPLGVLACVDIPAVLMQPSMSKQRFNDEREFKFLQKICLERACDYVKRVRMEFVKWEAYGYSSTTDPFMDPDLNPDVEKKLDDHLPAVFRCTECGKYRTVKNWKELNIEPEFFNCSENPDEKYNSCEKDEKRLFTKELDILPSIKTERADSDLEEVAVSPDKKKQRTTQNGSYHRIRNVSRGSSRVRSQSEDGFTSEDEQQVRRRLRRKRKSGRHFGNEVTSGFDRHRLASSESENESDSDIERDSNMKNKKHKTPDLQKLENQNKALQDRLKNEREKNEKLLEEMKSCVKHFYPTSWKSQTKYSHNEIETWKDDQIFKTSKVWKDSYTKDLKTIVSTCEKKKALKAKIEFADELQKAPQAEILKHIEKIKKEAQVELRKLKEGKN